MGDKRCSIPILLGLLLVGAASVTLAGDRSIAPHRYLPQADGKLVQLINPADGVRWAAWSYRAGAESDIALASLGADGIWSEPTFIGIRDGVSQVQPALTHDEAGNLYLAYAEPETGRVLLSTLTAGAPSWTRPLRVANETETVSSPNVAVIGDRLVLAYSAGENVRLLNMPVGRLRFQGLLSDGPDSLGMDGTGDGVDADGDMINDAPINEDDSGIEQLMLDSGLVQHVRKG